MKRLYIVAITASMLFAGCVEPYDDSELKNKLNDLQEQIDTQQSLLNAIANQKTISSVLETAEGYTITFSDGTSITLKHGDSLIQSITWDKENLYVTLSDGQVVIIPLERNESDIINENNKIYYTTNDNKKNFPAKSDGATFGAILINNTYKDGQGVITFDDFITCIGSFAFEKCYNFTSITIPNSVTLIGNYAFSECNSLTSISVPNSVIEIGSYAFSGCNSLTSIKIPYSVIKIGSNAFSNCTGELILNSKALGLYGGKFTKLIIGDNVTSIDEEAFSNCTSLRSISVPYSVTSIGRNAFIGCSGELAINSTELGTYGGNFTKLIIGDSITLINQSAFSGCSSLTSISIPNSVVSIGTSAFRSCVGLTDINIPDNVIEIKQTAFSGCSNLSSLTIGKSVKSIGKSAFARCTSLTELYCKPSNPPAIDSSIFGSTSPTPQIYVPVESVNAYKTAEGWSTFANNIVGYDYK